jgi:phage repressor protein C with HTH and peptisase S24 domain
MTEPLPPVFWLPMPDDAMAPRLAAGDSAKITVGLHPRPGDGVLLRDTGGNLFVRLYRVRNPGEWTAQAINPAFASLDAGRDDLVVIGVVTGVELPGRWA